MLCFFLVPFIILSAIDSRAENYHRAIVFVPGFKGTELIEERSNKIAWISLSEMFWGRRTLALSHPDFPVADALQLRPISIVRSAPFIPRLFERALYGDFLRHLTEHYGKSHQIIELPYDWRRSNQIASQQLFETIVQLRDRNIQDIAIISHSMGGLVLAHALKDLILLDVNLRLIFIGTPFGGVPSVLGDLTNETDSLFLNSNLLSREAFCSFESAYELLPSRYIKLILEHNQSEKFNLQNYEEWQAKQLGCYRSHSTAPQPNFTNYLRRQLNSAREFHRKINSAHLSPAKGTRILNLIGTGLATSNGCRVENFNKRRPLNCYSRSVKGLGDGVVTDSSARIPTALASYVHAEIEFPNIEHLQLMFEEDPRIAIRNFILNESAAISAQTF